MRLFWQPEWVEWENNVSCSDVILQVKIGLMKNILFERKADKHKGTAIFQIYFSNCLCSPTYPPFLKQCLSFSLPKAKLEWEKLETAIPFSGGLELEPVCLHDYAWEMAEVWQHCCQKGSVQGHDLSLVAFLFLWCRLG